MSDKGDQDYDLLCVCKICTEKEAFPTKKELVDHIKCKHLKESPSQNQNSSVLDEDKITASLNSSRSGLDDDVDDHRDPDDAENTSTDSESQYYPISDNADRLVAKNLKTNSDTQSESNNSENTDKVELKIDTGRELQSESTKPTPTTPQITDQINGNQSKLMEKAEPEISDDLQDISHKKRRTQESNLSIIVKRLRESQKVENSAAIEIRKVKSSPAPADTNDLKYFMFYECSQCTKLFLSKVNTEKHYQSDHGQSQSLFSATTTMTNYCSEKIFSMKTSDLTCPVCHAKFNRIFDQIVHIASHAEENFLSLSQGHPGNGRPQNESDAKTPVKIPSVKTTQKLKRKKKQKIHKVRTKNYRCDWCQRTFAASTLLRDHMGIHTGEKSHPCKHCSKEFRFSSGLRRHVRQLHQN